MRLQLLSLCVPGNTQHKYFFCWIEIQCSGDCWCKLALHDDLSRPCLAVHGQDRTLQFATFSPETLFCLAGILCPPILGRWIFFFYEDSSLEILGQKILGSRRWRWTIGSLRFRWFCWSQKNVAAQSATFLLSTNKRHVTLRCTIRCVHRAALLRRSSYQHTVVVRWSSSVQALASPPEQGNLGTARPRVVSWLSRPSHPNYCREDQHATQVCPFLCM